MTGSVRDLVTIKTPVDGLPLHVNGRRVVTLGLEYDCSWDHAAEYLAVESSRVRVVLGAKIKVEPLFRYEFLRVVRGRVPTAHLHVHAHRDSFTWLVGRTADPDDDHVPQLSDLHFPLGGARFRPCLEDVLETLIEEFAVDTQRPDARAMLVEGRILWRERQLRAAVRDDLEVAAMVLRANGYTVVGPAGERPAARRDRLGQH